MRTKSFPKGKKQVNVGNFVTLNEKNPHIHGTLIDEDVVKGKFGKQRVWLIKNGEKTFRVTGSANLNSQLETIKVGAEVFITYTGKTKTKGGFWVKTFEVTYN